jgi:hypothetical protein
MGTCAIKGTGENKGFGQRKTLCSKNYCQKKYPIKFYAPALDRFSLFFTKRMYFTACVRRLRNTRIRFYTL